ncbi:unnamed protein product [Auanema sp. JU1783]|nr:unnamed protein product [Auanema sp. JU1783]
MGKKSRARKRAESRRAARESESLPRDSDSNINDSVDSISVQNSDLASSDEQAELMSSGLNIAEVTMTPPEGSSIRSSRLPIRISSLPLSCSSSPSSSPRLIPGEKKSRIPRLLSLRELIKSRSGYNSEMSDESHLEVSSEGYN